MNYEPGDEQFRRKVARRMATHIRRLAVEMYASRDRDEVYYYESVIQSAAFAVGITSEELKGILAEARRYEPPECRERGKRGE